MYIMLNYVFLKGVDTNPSKCRTSANWRIPSSVRILKVILNQLVTTHDSSIVAPFGCISSELRLLRAADSTEPIAHN